MPPSPLPELQAPYRRLRDRDASRQVPPPRTAGEFSPGFRALLWVIGILLFLLGIAGLFLPILQGFLFLVLAAAVLTVASNRLYRWSREVISPRWPGAWKRIERFRTGLRWKYRKRGGSGANGNGSNGSGSNGSGSNGDGAS